MDSSPVRKKQRKDDDDGESSKHRRSPIASEDETSGSDAGDVGPAPAEGPPKGGAEAAGSSKTPAAKSRNAFSELMSKKPKPSPKPTKSATASSSTTTALFNPRDPRDSLGLYILHPEKHPASYSAQENRRLGVIQYDENFVTVWDAYPKSTVHILLLSRNPVIARSHPIDALDDPTFLSAVREKVAELKRLAAGELQRLLVNDSALELARRSYLESLEKRAAEDENFDYDAEALKAPAGRNWEECIKAGVHARPSMHHFHIHVMSIDMRSPCVKKKIHYNSFNTGFFVKLEEFPLTEDDERRVENGSCKKFHEEECKCWRCGKVIGGRKGGGMEGIREHMREEFNEWKKI